MEEVEYIYYMIEDHDKRKGFWKPRALGYTHEKTEAGVFRADNLAKYNLDECTLFKATREQVEKHLIAEEKRQKEIMEPFLRGLALAAAKS